MTSNDQHSTQRKSPRHVAIIMDGNGRWAKAHHVPRNMGHRQGVEAVRQLVRALKGTEIEFLTLYGFSSENWSRPETEVNDLMGLLRFYIQRDLAELVSNNVRIRIIGSQKGLAADLVELINKAEKQSAENTGLTLIIAFNYGGRDEITHAVSKIADQIAKGDFQAADISPDHVAQNLYTKDIPDPDLIIRTSGEQRLSNFLTWQAAYAELVFMPILWPDFTKDHLLEAIAEYHNRERRFGGRPDAEEPDATELLSATANRLT